MMDLKRLMRNKDLKRRVIDISYKKKLSHLSSCLNSVDIIEGIYAKMNDDDMFILSSGHAGLALYVVLEKYSDVDAEELFDKHGVHPNRDVGNGIHASAGSLGHGLGIAVGHALANRKRDVHVLISDGECSEGSIFEALRVADELRLSNLCVYVNVNGYAAFKEVQVDRLAQMLDTGDFPQVQIIGTTMKPFKLDSLQGLSGHYHVLSLEEYCEIKDTINKP